MKRLTRSRRFPEVEPFHRRKAVAPLKRSPAGNCQQLVGRFPSPKGGGPIEAGNAPRFTTVEALFPSPKGGGPIEAMPVREEEEEP